MGQVPRITTYVIPPANITTTPPQFRKGQTVSFSASLIAPEKYADAAIGIRIYNVDENSGEPTVSTSSLLQAKSNYDFSSAPGTKVQVTFESVTIPAEAGVKLYAVVWNFYPVKTPEGIDETGHIIYNTHTNGFELGGATFRFDCGVGKRTSLCVYRKE
jgi:hypothetical protein